MRKTAKAMIIALIICGTLYLIITFNYVAIISTSEIKPVMGLYQLTEKISPRYLSTFIITVFSVFALATNFNSWIRGLSSMIEKSSIDHDLPSYLSTPNQSGKKAIHLLSLLFTMVLLIQCFNPHFLENALTVVSTNFVLVYILTTISFIRITESLPKKLMAITTLMILIFSVMSKYEYLIYPVIISTTYFYQAYDSNGEQVTLAFGILLRSEEWSYQGSSFSRDGYTWKDTGDRGSREIWPHYLAKYETIKKERQINTSNFRQGTFLASNDIYINADDITNDKSLIAANNDIYLTGIDYRNIAGSFKTTRIIDTFMERRERHCDPFCSYDHYTYWLAPEEISTEMPVFTTLQAGNKVVFQVSNRIGNRDVSEGTTNEITPEVSFTEITNQTTDVNFGSIAGRNNLFKPTPDITSPYLYETGSEFIDPSKFFGSSYFLDQIPNFSQNSGDEFFRRRYGDAYVEDRLVRDQIFGMTGQRLLSEYVDPEVQMKDLYDNALSNMDELGLSFGVALTQDQISKLTKDMIWMEETVVNGQTVLIPKVYLSKVTLENLNQNGSHIVGSEVTLRSGNLFNTGAIDGKKSLTIDTGTLFNFGGTITGGDVNIAANAILNKRLKEEVEFNNSEYSEFANPWTGETKTVKTKTNEGSYTLLGQDSIISSKGNLNITTKGDIQNIGGTISSGKDLNIEAGGEIISTSVTESKSWEYKQKSYEEKESSLTHHKGLISSGGAMNVSGNKITLVGTDVDSGSDLTLKAKNGVEIISVQDQRSYSLKKKEGGNLLVGNSDITKDEYSLTTNASEITANGNLNIISDSGDITLKATKLDADNYNVTATDGDINLESNKDIDYKKETSEQSGLLLFKNTDKGHNNEKVQGVVFDTKENEEIYLKAHNINIDIVENGTAELATEELSKLPELAWLKNLKNSDEVNINWNEVEEIRANWDETQSGLSQTGALLVSIAVSIAAGPAAGAIASGVGGAGGAALAAGFSSLVSQASVSLINNGGDLGAVFAELSSSDSLRGLAVTMVTAGAASQLSSAAGWSDKLKQPGGALTYGEKALRAGGNAVIRAGAETALNGASFEDSLMQNLEAAGISYAGEVAANEIGDAYHNEKLENKSETGVYRADTGDYVTHKLAHAALGCAMGVASGGDCGAGATAGVLAEVVAEALVNDFFDDVLTGKVTQEDVLDPVNYVEYNKNKITQIAGAVAILSSGLLGEDPNIAQQIGENAAEHNSASLMSVGALMAAFAAAALLVDNASKNTQKQEGGASGSIELLSPEERVLLHIMQQGVVKEGDEEIIANPEEAEKTTSSDNAPQTLEEELAIEEAMGADESELIDMDNIDIEDVRLINEEKEKKRYYHRYPEKKANGDKGIDVHLEVDKNGVRSKPKIKRE